MNDERRWEWRQETTKQLLDIIFTSVIHWATSPQEDGSTVHCSPGPPVFIDDSLCLHLTQYQPLASENSLGSTSIIQPSCAKGTSREGRINLEACRRRWNNHPVCERGGQSAISIFCHGPSRMVGGDWAFLGVGRLEGKSTASIVEVGNECTSARGETDAYLCPAMKGWNWAHGGGDVRSPCSTHAQFNLLFQFCFAR